MKWQNRLLVLLALQSLAGIGLAHAQERLVLAPPLSEVFPLDPKPDGMRLKFPVLLNSRTVLGPDVVLRFIYVDPNAAQHPRGGAGGDDQGGGGSGGGHGHHHGGGGGSGDSSDVVASPHGSAGAAAAPSGSSQDATPASKDVTSEIRTEVWNQASLFREALDDASDMGTTLVYYVPGKQKSQSTTIDLPDGMLLAQIGDHITVLAMTEESKAFQSGIHPQDEIRSIEGAPTPATLTDFAHQYLQTQEQARQANKSYSVEVWRPTESRLITIPVAAPPSLPSMF
jgi:hypothetical protein